MSKKQVGTIRRIDGRLNLKCVYASKLMLFFRSETGYYTKLTPDQYNKYIKAGLIRKVG